MAREARPQLPAGTFNAWIGQDATDDDGPRDLRDNVRRVVADAGDVLGAPLVALCLQEVWDWDGTIPGFIPIRARLEDFGAEGRSTQWLIRDDAEILHTGFRQVPGGDWTWNGNRKQPRVFPRVVIRWDRQVWDLVGVHRIPGGPEPAIDLNRTGWNAEHTMLDTWQARIADNRRGEVRALFGDWNAAEDERPGYPYSIASLAESVNAEAALRHIDGALVAGAGVRDLQRLENKYGSDGHHPVVMTLVSQV